jgi:hypothetical protein
MKHETFLFLFEPSSLEAFLEGKSTPVYSHDLNLMQLAQSAINLGVQVFIANFHDSQKIYSTQSMWPIVNLQSSLPHTTVTKQLTFTFSANHIAFINRERSNRRDKNRNRNILVQAAIHPIEDPTLFYPAGISSYINVVRNQIDFFVTQNSRMKDLLFRLLSLVAGCEDSNRILISKLVPRVESPSPKDANRRKFRKQISIGIDDILFVNAGGAWSWTLFHEFLEAFAKAVSDFPETKIHFFQPALGQGNNSSHLEYNKKTLQILSGLTETQKSRILVGDGWDADGKLISEMLDAADYGISFSQESLEHWQSYRVRILEYLAHTVPVITSRGSFWDEEKTGVGFIFAGHHDNDLYDVISEVIRSHNPELILQRKEDLGTLLDNLTLQNQGERLISELVKHPLRDQKPKISNSPIWDFREFAEPKRIGTRRLFKRIYYKTVNNTHAHKLLVRLGVRRFVRFLRKIR